VSGDHHSGLAAKTAALRDVYTAINRNDIPAVVAGFDPEIVCVDPPGFPSSPAYRGLRDVKAHFVEARETWAEGGCMPERFIVAGDKIVVFVHVRVRLKNQQEWIDGRTADVFTFRDGKITEMRTFVERQHALTWAGVDTASET